MFMSWHHQCEGQRRAEDLLCSHRDDPISVTRDCDALSINALTHRTDLRTQSHTQGGRRGDSSCSLTKAHYQKPAVQWIDNCQEPLLSLATQCRVGPRCTATVLQRCTLDGFSHLKCNKDFAPRSLFTV